MAALLAAGAILAAGLAIVPSTVQTAQANPCATEVDGNNNEIDNFKCKFFDEVEIDEISD